MENTEKVLTIFMHFLMLNVQNRFKNYKLFKTHTLTHTHKLKVASTQSKTQRKTKESQEFRAYKIR